MYSNSVPRCYKLHASGKSKPAWGTDNLSGRFGYVGIVLECL